MKYEVKVERDIRVSMRDGITLATDVPARCYNKIRLTVSEIKLVKLDADGDPVEFNAKINGNGKIDLNPRGTFCVGPDETVLFVHTGGAPALYAYLDTLLD